MVGLDHAGQFLSDVDITVHCDCNIFEWLTKWMNSSPPPPICIFLNSFILAPKGKTIIINQIFFSVPSNVVPILLSAAFLETTKLVEECLDFCHKHANQILDAKQSFSCLNDQLIEK